MNWDLPRPSEMNNNGSVQLHVPMPPWVSEALRHARERLNAITLTEIDGNENIGYGKDCDLSLGEYVQEIALMACWHLPAAPKVSIRKKARRTEAVWPIEEGWPSERIHLNRGAASSILRWVGGHSYDDLVGFIQWALKKEAIELPREENDVEPILRLQGSKNRIASWVVEYIPTHRAFVDVHGGTASVIGAKGSSHLEVFNDLHAGVVNLWRVIRERPDELVRALVATPYSRVEWQAAREADCPDDPVEWARRVMVASWMGYGGDWQRTTNGFRCGAALLQSRTTPTRDWQVVIGRVQRWAERMRGVLLECMKDVDLIARYDNPETVFYCDPPYHATKHKANYANEYTEADHRKLAEVLHGIKGAAMISGYESDLYSELYGDWLCVKRKVKANRGAVREECLWLCPKAKGQITARLL